MICTWKKIQGKVNVLLLYQSSDFDSNRRAWSVANINILSSSPTRFSSRRNLSPLGISWNSDRSSGIAAWVIGLNGRLTSHHWFPIVLFMFSTIGKFALATDEFVSSSLAMTVCGASREYPATSFSYYFTLWF